MVFIRFYRSGRSLEMSGSQNPSDLSKTLPDPLWRKDPGVRVTAYPTLTLALSGPTHSVSDALVLQLHFCSVNLTFCNFEKYFKTDIISRFADEPEFVINANFEPKYFANFFSNSYTFLPMVKFPLFKTFSTSAISVFDQLLYAREYFIDLDMIFFNSYSITIIDKFCLTK